MIRKKSELVRSTYIGGAMIWALDLDDFRNRCGCETYPLLKTINRVLRNYRQSNAKCDIKGTYLHRENKSYLSLKNDVVCVAAVPAGIDQNTGVVNITWSAQKTLTERTNLIVPVITIVSLDSGVHVLAQMAYTGISRVLLAKEIYCNRDIIHFCSALIGPLRLAIQHQMRRRYKRSCCSFSNNNSIASSTRIFDVRKATTRSD